MPDSYLLIMLMELVPLGRCYVYANGADMQKCAKMPLRKNRIPIHSRYDLISISVFRVAASGKPLPTPRFISRAVHPDSGFHDHAVTLLLVAWGQFLDHDITLSAETRDPRTGKTPKCCDGSGPGPAHPNCLPIEIPAEDGFFRQHGQRCMNFVRTLAGLQYDCRLGPRRSFNEISSFIDAGTVYSNDEHLVEQLRAFKGGQLKVSSELVLIVYNHQNCRIIITYLSSTFKY